MSHRITVRPMRRDETDAIIRLWHTTARVAYPYLPTEQAHSLDDARAFFRDRVAPTHDLFVAEAEGALLGYMAIRGSYIDRLYIHPDVQRSGAGTALLATARARSPPDVEYHWRRSSAEAG